MSNAEPTSVPVPIESRALIRIEALPVERFEGRRVNRPTPLSKIRKGGGDYDGRVTAFPRPQCPQAAHEHQPRRRRRRIGKVPE
jgi:hypothetical protein